MTTIISYYCPTEQLKTAFGIVCPLLGAAARGYLRDPSVACAHALRDPPAAYTQPLQAPPVACAQPLRALLGVARAADLS